MNQVKISTITGLPDGNFLNLGASKIIQIKIDGESDVTNALFIPQPGEDCSPVIGDRIITLRIYNFYICFGSLDKIQPSSEEGEKFIYSRDEFGDVAALVKLLKNGDIEINGNTDFAVRFSKLEEGFNQMKSDINTLITAFNGFTGLTIPQSLASIANAKIENIRVK